MYEQYPTCMNLLTAIEMPTCRRCESSGKGNQGCRVRVLAAKLDGQALTMVETKPRRRDVITFDLYGALFEEGDSSFTSTDPW